MNNLFKSWYDTQVM